MARFSSLALLAYLASQSDASSKSALRSSVVFENQSRQLSYEFIAGYLPESSVTDHNAIDLDQAAIEQEIAKKNNDGFENAKAIYEQGGHSKSYASLGIVGSLSGEVVEGTPITGQNSLGNEVTGKAYGTNPAGARTLNVQYSTTDLQESYVGCQVGGLSKAGLHNADGCFNATGVVTVGSRTQLAYQYDPLEDNNNGRTIQGFSKQVESKMLECAKCPYKDAKYFVDYYGRPDYADEWVQAAFSGRPTSLTRGMADFSKYGYDGQIEAIKKGTAYLNVFMYVIREFEDALDDCKNGCIGCNDDPVHAWDEGVAFYTGSMEGKDGLSDGRLLHQLADKRCIDYKTCGANGNGITGTSKLNMDLLDLFNQGQGQLLAGECENARVTKNKIVDLMYIPMIQGTIRYAHKVEFLSAEEKGKAEGATFAAAILPRVHAANADAAKTIYDNMKVGASSTSLSEVKGAFESVYPAMNVNCAQVGGLWDDSSNAYYQGAEPCSAGATIRLAIGSVVGVVAVIFGLMY